MQIFFTVCFFAVLFSAPCLGQTWWNGCDFECIPGTPAPDPSPLYEHHNEIVSSTDGDGAAAPSPTPLEAPVFEPHAPPMPMPSPAPSSPNVELALFPPSSPVAYLSYSTKTDLLAASQQAIKVLKKTLNSNSVCRAVLEGMGRAGERCVQGKYISDSDLMISIEHRNNDSMIEFSATIISKSQNLFQVSPNGGEILRAKVYVFFSFDFRPRVIWLSYDVRHNPLGFWAAENIESPRSKYIMNDPAIAEFNGRMQSSMGELF